MHVIHNKKLLPGHFIENLTEACVKMVHMKSTCWNIL